MERVNMDEIEIDYSDQGSPTYTWKDEPFTGIAYELGDDGKLLNEAAYIEGIQEGALKSWYPNGQLQSVIEMKFNRPHGNFQHWYEDGRLKNEGVAELGHVLRRKEWNASGVLENDYRIESNPEELNSLALDRETFNKLGLI